MASKKLRFSEVKPLKLKLEKRLLTSYLKEDWGREMKMIHSRVKESFKVSEVVKVNNPYVYGMYLLHKQEMMNNSDTVKEELLYHCTSPRKAREIASENIDWRLTCRTRFGKGACFSENPRYAHSYAGSKGAFVVCKVLTDSVQILYGVDYDLEIPSDGYDTTLGNGDCVCVKYDDFTFYPKYIVYYD